MTDRNIQPQPLDAPEPHNEPLSERGNTTLSTHPGEYAAHQGVGRFAVNARAARRRKPRRARQGTTQREQAKYTATALSAFEYCEQSVNQFRTLVAIAATILRAPPVNSDERHSHQTMMALLLETAKGYQRDAEGDRALFEVLVLDARNIHGTHMSADEAMQLLSARRKESAHYQA